MKTTTILPVRPVYLGTIETPAELVVALKAATVCQGKKLIDPPADDQARPATQTETRTYE